MKYEWKKNEKEIYLPKNKPSIVNIPKLKYFTVEGTGNPNNNPIFQENITLLYTMSYAVRMMPKNGHTPTGYYEYTVYPLEGIWDLTEKGRKADILNKDEFMYTIMIRQPDFVNEEVVSKALEIINKKKPGLDLSRVKFEEIEEGMCLQMLHIGSFDDEPQSFKKMQDYLEENNYQRRLLTHKEIYISDFRKAATNKLKTVLRYWIEKK